ncbi:MAG: multidrug transporter [Marinobacter sp.]|nr:multidrug transporter [Marinobacter sp.]
MSYDVAVIVLAIGGGLALIAGLVFFRHPRWLLDWVKGMVVLALLFIGGYAVLVAVSLTQYQSLADMQSIASVGVSRVGPQSWRVRLETPGEPAVTASISGDQWQLDARIIRFSGPLRWLGVAPGYQLERLSGRYIALEQERNSPRTVVALTSGQGWPDIWQLDQQFNLPFVEGVYGNATFMPMADGAVFDVRLSGSGLVAVPANERARKAVNEWTGQ